MSSIERAAFRRLVAVKAKDFLEALKGYPKYNRLRPQPHEIQAPLSGSDY
jgi:hypothetical protein